MLYISRGMVLQPSTPEHLRICRCGMERTLTGELSRLWLAGRFSAAEANGTGQEKALGELAEMGLAMPSEETGELALYRLLVNCIICPAKLRPLRQRLSNAERRAWEWISKSGIRLTISELVFLMEHDIAPTASLIGRENWHTLVGMIYTADTIPDGILITQMERSPARAGTVEAVLGLLRKKRILLV